MNNLSPNPMGCPVQLPVAGLYVKRNLISPPGLPTRLSGVRLQPELPNCRTAELPNCRTAELPNP
jgi:hypothetical protein